MRLPFALVVLVWCVALVACRQDAAAPADAAPEAGRGLDLTTALVVDVRETSDGEGHRGDVVVELSRSGSAFDWDGKAVPFPDTLGERVPDPHGWRKCSCSVTAACPGCDGVSADDIQRKHGTVKAAVVEAFLAEIMRHPREAQIDAGAQPGHVEKVHVAIALPGRDDPVHLSFGDSRRIWTLDDRALGGDKAAVEGAWNALRDALGIGAWLAELAPPVASGLPPDFAHLDRAAIVEVFDSWNGLGPTHDWALHLERKGAGFAWHGKLASFANSLGDSVPDPYTPAEKDNKPCVCSVDAKCGCEHAMALVRESGTIAAAPVEKFLRTVAAHTIDPAPPPIGRRWTDDYPNGHVIVWMTPDAHPIHLSFLDQQRQWRVDGRALSRDPSEPRGGIETQHSTINASFEAMLDALGQKHWLDEVSKTYTPRRVK